MSKLESKLTLANLGAMMAITTAMIVDGRLKEAEKNLELITNAVKQLNENRGDLSMQQTINKTEV